MAEYHQQQGEIHKVSGRSMVCTSLASVAVTAPLLDMMGFSFMATLVLLVIRSPLLLIFSPLLLCVGLVFAGALAGFAVAATMALAGVSTLAWMNIEIGGSAGVGCGMTGRLEEFGDKGAREGLGWVFAAKGAAEFT